MKTILLGLGVAAVALAAALFWRGGEDNDPHLLKKKMEAEAAAGKSGRPLGAEAVLSIRPRAVAGAEPTPARMPPLLHEFATAKIFKPIYERLQKASTRSPEETWLMAEILQRCATPTERKSDAGKRWTLNAESQQKFAASMSEKDPNRAKRIAAFEKMNADPCEGFNDVEVSEKDIRRLFEASAAGNDPKARAALVRLELEDQMRGPDGRVRFDPSRLASITDSQIETLRGSVQSGDPYAVRAAIVALALPMQNLSLRAGPGELPLEIGSLYQAGELLGCDLGQPCGPDSRPIVQACAMRGWCETRNYRDYLFFYQSSPANSQLIGEYYEGLTRAARRGDWSYFTFHRGPSPQVAPFVPR